MTQTVKICNPSWHALKGEQFQWNNDTKQTCTLTRNDSHTFPFAGGPSLKVAPGISAGRLRDDLPDGTYTYNVDCCDKSKTAPKNVTIP